MPTVDSVRDAWESWQAFLETCRKVKLRKKFRANPLDAIVALGGTRDEWNRRIEFQGKWFGEREILYDPIEWLEDTFGDDADEALKPLEWIWRKPDQKSGGCL